MLPALTSRPRALLALLLLVPIPSLGVLSGMVFWPNTPLGAALFGASKIWIALFPLVWSRFIEGDPIRLSPAREGGFGMALATGAIIAAAMLLGYRLAGDALIDRDILAARMHAIGLDRPLVYACGAAYWILVNSVLEEYVWRWFCVKHCQRLMPPVVAIAVSALCFTLHHVLAMLLYFSPRTVLVCATGVFIGGAVWSAMYVRYRSVWPGYLSHAIADLAIFAIGAHLVFGRA